MIEGAFIAAGGMSGGLVLVQGLFVLSIKDRIRSGDKLASGTKTGQTGTAGFSFHWSSSL